MKEGRKLMRNVAQKYRMLVAGQLGVDCTVMVRDCK